MLPKKPANPGTRGAFDAETCLKRHYPPQSDLVAAGVTILRPCIIVDVTSQRLDLLDLSIFGYLAFEDLLSSCAS
jgi:hypothetical protein